MEILIRIACRETETEEICCSEEIVKFNCIDECTPPFSIQQIMSLNREIRKQIQNNTTRSLIIIYA